MMSTKPGSEITTKFNEKNSENIVADTYTDAMNKKRKNTCDLKKNKKRLRNLTRGNILYIK